MKIIESMTTLALSDNPRLRSRLRSILMVVAIYGLSLLGQWHAVRNAMADPEFAKWLGWMIAIGMAVFYGVVRSGLTRHLTDPAGKIYYATMEEGLYEVDVKSLAVKNFIRDGNGIKKDFKVETPLSKLDSQLPGYHGKGLYSSQGRVIYANNGDRDKRVMTNPTTPSGATGQVVKKGNLYDEMFNDFLTASLGGGVIDSWDVDIAEGESLYVTVVAPSPADIILSVLKDGQPIIDRQNTAPAGAPEMINNPSLSGEGIYEIQVLTIGQVSTDYALTFYTDPEVPVTIAGIITPGSQRSAVDMPADSYHYWFFVGSAGDDVTITLRPSANEDPALDLHGPDGEYIDTVDDGLEGEEEILEMTLEMSGLHAIGVDGYGEPLRYDLELAIN